MYREAFAILQYQCSCCSRLDFIWNGTELRPPFSVPCSTRNCYGVMSRVNWHDTPRRRKYTVPMGARYFVLATADHARELACSTLGMDADEERILSFMTKFLRANPFHLVQKLPQLPTKVSGATSTLGV